MMITPLLMLTIMASIFGMVIGSFLNVVIHRIPRGESVIWPGSHCPTCGAGIRPLDNVPLLSFILLRGRCRSCQSAISSRYPMIELLTAVVFGALIWKNGPTPEVLPEMLFAAAIIALIGIDVETRTLPNIITYPLLLFGLLANLWRSGWGEPIIYSFDFSLLLDAGEVEVDLVRLAIQGGLLLALATPALWLLDRLDLLLFGKYFGWDDIGSSPDDERWEREERIHNRVIFATILIGLLIGAAWIIGVRQYGESDRMAIENASEGLQTALAGALTGVLPVWLLRTLHFLIRGREGMGLGDIKLLAGIGAFLGWQGVLGSILLGSIGGSVIGLLLLRRSDEGLQTTIPFGCFLGLASLLVLFKSGL